MIKLDMETVLRNARKAYDEGRLQAQKPVEPSISCTYAGPCAIGVSINPDLRSTLDAEDDSTVMGLVKARKVSFNDWDETRDASSLQGSHDLWHGASNRDGELYTTRHVDFLRTLTNLETKYAV